MLVLSRKINETIVIDGRIRIKVIRVEGDIVKLGIDAPPSVPVHRQEVYEEILKSNREAATAPGTTVPGFRPKHSESSAPTPESLVAAAS